MSVQRQGARSDPTVGDMVRGVALRPALRLGVKLLPLIVLVAAAWAALLTTLRVGVRVLEVLAIAGIGGACIALVTAVLVSL
jgi:hypothetical protein